MLMTAGKDFPGVKVMVRKSPIIHDPLYGCDCLIPCNMPWIASIGKDGNLEGIYIREWNESKEATERRKRKNAEWQKLGIETNPE